MTLPRVEYLLQPTDAAAQRSTSRIHPKCNDQVLTYRALSTPSPLSLHEAACDDVVARYVGAALGRRESSATEQRKVQAHRGDKRTGRAPPAAAPSALGSVERGAAKPGECARTGQAQGPGNVGLEAEVTHVNSPPQMPQHRRAAHAARPALPPWRALCPRCSAAAAASDEPVGCCELAVPSACTPQAAAPPQCPSASGLRRRRPSQRRRRAAPPACRRAPQPHSAQQLRHRRPPARPASSLALPRCTSPCRAAVSDRGGRGGGRSTHIAGSS